MKNCDEMVNSLLERRERYHAEQKKKKAIIIRAATSMCCVCLVALLGFGMWQGGMFHTTPPARATGDALYPDIKDNFDESNGESPDAPTVNNKIIVHQMDGLLLDMSTNIDLFTDDFVAMDKAELNEYYGINVFPTIPDDLKEWEDQRFGVYKRDGGTGDVYWDATGLNYSNEDYSRTVSVAIEKDALPLCDYAFLESIEEKSIINHAEVAIGQSNNGYYYAQFMYRNIGFRIVANGLTQDEFVAMIASIIR